MTGQEYIQRQINLVKQQIKGSKVKFIITDVVTKHQYDFYENELQALESIEKEHNALEIIKKKTVAVAMLKSCGTVKRYNIIAFDEEHFKDKDYARKLTEEEFELLKEVLE